MEIKVSTENGRVPVTVLHVDGNIDSGTYEEFELQADKLIKEGARYLLVDLAKAPFVSSAGLRALQHIFKQLHSLHSDPDLNTEDTKQGIRTGTYKSSYLKLLNLSPEIRTAFEMSGFNMYMETFSDLETAIASF
jgi:anti-anti-sigma factor